MSLRYPFWCAKAEPVEFKILGLSARKLDVKSVWRRLLVTIPGPRGCQTKFGCRFGVGRLAEAPSEAFSTDPLPMFVGDMFFLTTPRNTSAAALVGHTGLQIPTWDGRDYTCG